MNSTYFGLLKAHICFDLYTFWSHMNTGWLANEACAVGLHVCRVRLGPIDTYYAISADVQLETYPDGLARLTMPNQAGVMYFHRSDGGPLLEYVPGFARTDELGVLLEQPQFASVYYPQVWSIEWTLASKLARNLGFRIEGLKNLASDPGATVTALWLRDYREIVGVWKGRVARSELLRALGLCRCEFSDSVLEVIGTYFSS